MRDFSYHRARSLDDAVYAAKAPEAVLLAGGTSLLDLAKCGVVEPGEIIDISHITGLDAITVDERGASIGALARMARVAGHAGIRARFPAISEALLLAASAQIRNMATIGGNLLQRTRCAYFRDPETFPACNKRLPGSGCAAIGGVNRNHAVLGISDACIATYPGDLAVALVAFDATIHIGQRQVAVDDFFLAPGATPEREHVLEKGEIITAVTIPALPAALRSTYLKVRDRQSYEFAVASAAVGIAFEADGRTIRDLRVALGGVATRPWRARTVEAALKGKILEPETVARASLLAMEGAVDNGANKYKIELAPRVVARAILTMGEMA
jgi:xanthine dehydrogenase YagS FAD-binding subunit